MKKSDQFLLLVLSYFSICIIDSFFMRNVKKRILYRNSIRFASENDLKLVVVGSPHLDLQDGGLISYATEKITGPMYGCGDICVDLKGCPKCRVSYTGDVLEFLREQNDSSCVLFSTGVFEFTDNYEEIYKEVKRTCVRNFTDYYSPWNITWYTYGCSPNSSGESVCGLFKGYPSRFFWTNPFNMSGKM